MFTEPVDPVASGVFNTEMAVLHRSCEFHSLEPHDREIHYLLSFKKVVLKKLLKDSDVFTSDDVKTVIGLLDSVKLKALVELWCSFGPSQLGSSLLMQ